MSNKELLKEKIIAFRKDRNFETFKRYFINHPKEINDLVQFITDKEPYPIAEYSSWMLIHIVKNNSHLLKHHYQSFVDILFETSNQSVLRNVTRTLSDLQITEYRESELIDLLISFIQNHENKVALHVYSIYVLIQFVDRYPELRQEIEEIIDLNKEGKSVAYKVAQRNFIQHFEKSTKF